MHELSGDVVQHGLSGDVVQLSGDELSGYATRGITTPVGASLVFGVVPLSKSSKRGALGSEVLYIGGRWGASRARAAKCCNNWAVLRVVNQAVRLSVYSGRRVRPDAVSAGGGGERSGVRATRRATGARFFSIYQVEPSRPHPSPNQSFLRIPFGRCFSRVFRCTWPTHVLCVTSSSHRVGDYVPHGVTQCFLIFSAYGLYFVLSAYGLYPGFLCLQRFPI